MIGIINNPNEIHDYLTKEVDKTIDGKCSGCGGCCGNFLPISEADLKHIHKYIKRHNINPVKVNQVPFTNTVITMMCPFLDTIKCKCLIYDIRPKVCVYFTCNKNSRAEITPNMLGKNVEIIDMNKEFSDE